MVPEIVLEGGLVDVGDGDFRRADVVVSEGRIVRVGDAGERPGGEIVDCSRLAVVPGMVDAHYHSNDNFDRGRWDNLPLEPYMLFSYPSLAAPKLTPLEIYVRTLVGGLELVRSGATCVVDFLYELSGFSDESLAAVVEAYRDLGLRAVVALAISDLAYHETVVMDLGLVRDDVAERLTHEKPPPWADWEAFARRAVERFHRPEEGISIGLAPSGPQRCSDALLQGCAALADELDLVIHIHVLETKMQALSGIKTYGKTLPEHLEAIGFLSPRVSFEHGIWLTDSDIALTAERGVTIVHNPLSNMKLGSGVCPVPLLLQGGVNVALGGDSASCNDGCDMFQSLKLAGVLHKTWDVDYGEWLGAKEAWRMATLGSARSAGEGDELGRLEAGRRADLVLLDLDSHCFTPLNDPLRQLVLCSPRSAVVSTIVGGRFVLRDGAVTGVDEASILAEARELGPSLVERSAEALELGDALLASVRAGWLEALHADVAVARSIPLRSAVAR